MWKLVEMTSAAQVCDLFCVLKAIVLIFFSSCPGVAAVKDSVPLSPLKPAATPTEQQSSDRGNAALGKDLQSTHASSETSNLRPQTPKAEDKVEEDEDAGGLLTISELVYRSVHIISLPSCFSTPIEIKRNRLLDNCQI